MKISFLAVIALSLKPFALSQESYSNSLGESCQMSGSGDLFVVGSPYENSGKGAAYLYNTDGTIIKKLTASNDYASIGNEFGYTTAIDRKVVVGSFLGKYVEVFDLDGTPHCTISCDSCVTYDDDEYDYWSFWGGFGNKVATAGDRIVLNANNETSQTQIYSTSCELLETLDVHVSGLAMSNDTIVISPARTRSYVYSNLPEDDFRLVSEIMDMGGSAVATRGDKIVFGDGSECNDNDSAALYSIYGNLIKKLDRSESSCCSRFGLSVSMNEEKIFVGAPLHDFKGLDEDANPILKFLFNYGVYRPECIIYDSGAVSVYSSTTGDFEEKIEKPEGDIESQEYFGKCVGSSDDQLVVGQFGKGGAVHTIDI